MCWSPKEESIQSRTEQIIPSVVKSSAKMRTENGLPKSATGRILVTLTRVI